MEEQRQEESNTFRGMMEIPVKYALFQILEAIKAEYIVEYLVEKGYRVTKTDEESSGQGASADRSRD
jgi:hypothetical protein